MADETITVFRLNNVLDALKNYPKIALPELEAATYRNLNTLVGLAADYPAAPPNSHYRRTGNFGRLWTAAQPEWQGMTSGFEGSIGNASGYGEWVQGQHQAQVHAGRWETVRQLEEKQKRSVIAIYVIAVRRINDKINGVTS